MSEFGAVEQMTDDQARLPVVKRAEMPSCAADCYANIANTGGVSCYSATADLMRPLSPVWRDLKLLKLTPVLHQHHRHSMSLYQLQCILFPSIVL